MPIILTSLLAFAAVTPPIIMAAPPPPIATTAYRGRQTEVQTTSVIEIEIRQARMILWRGDLSLASNGSASFNQRKQESFACAADRAPGRNSTARGTGITLYINGSYGNNDLVNVNVEWTRPMTDLPSDASTCTGEETGTLTARIQSQVDLAKGKTVTLNGDGGLSISLTRR